MKTLARCRDSLEIAFSMYSALPSRQREWTKESTRYVMCFFPLVGAVTGALFAGWACLASYLGLSAILRSAVLVVIPVAVTGGIHLDGFLDSCDALSSWRTREDRIRILKDPHAGAFAVIWAIVYFLLLFAVLCSLDLRLCIVCAFGFVISRALSGFSVVTFPKLSADGTVAAFSKNADTRVIQISCVVYIALAALFMLLIAPLYAFAVLLGAAVSFAWYHRQAMKYFGGINGDLAGYFLTLCELLMPLAALLFSVIAGL